MIKVKFSRHTRFVRDALLYADFSRKVQLECAITSTFLVVFPNFGISDPNSAGRDQGHCQLARGNIQHSNFIPNVSVDLI